MVREVTLYHAKPERVPAGEAVELMRPEYRTPEGTILRDHHDPETAMASTLVDYRMPVMRLAETKTVQEEGEEPRHETTEEFVALDPTLFRLVEAHRKQIEDLEMNLAQQRKLMERRQNHADQQQLKLDAVVWASFWQRLKALFFGGKVLWEDVK